MSWAARRRFFILSILGAIGVAFLAIVIIATTYHAPSCHDGIQNQGEQGVDCGGPCPYLCTALEQTPSVLYTQALPAGPGRTDVIAAIENRNATAAAKNVPWTVVLYAPDNTFVQQKSGTVDLPPGATVPVFIPNISTGSQTVKSAFLTIASSSPRWYTMATDTRAVPKVLSTNLAGTTQAPRVTAVLQNPDVTLMSNVRAVVVVQDAQGNVIGASQTIVPSIPGSGQATATFTWNAPFSQTPAAITVTPIVPLP